MSHSMTSEIVKTDCGCGGGSGCGCGGSSKSPCGCDITACGDCEPQNITRPRFFAGQLLTEDDLQLLADYVVHKSRLHNRHLHGSGVVCGLLVTCHPCGGGKVLVEPGYALDCCGNDILVPCPKELDINDMVRRLRIEKLGGYDCGDPCEDHDMTDAPRPGMLANEERAEDVKPTNPSRRYCLYLNYCENLTEPVAPYVTEEPCGQLPCEPTRVEEGFRFELRCPSEEPEPDDLLTRIRCCIADLAGAEKTFASSQRYHKLASQTETAALMYREKPTITLTVDNHTALDEAAAALTEFSIAVKEKGEVPDEIRLRKALDQFHGGATLVARYLTLDGNAKKEQEALTPGIAGSVEATAGQVREMAPLFVELLPTLSVESDRRVVEAISADIERYTDLQVQPEAVGFEHYLFANGVPTDTVMKMQEARDLAGIREWLLSRLDQSPTTDCRLRKEVESISISNAQQNPELAAQVALQLAQAVIRYLLDCICRALNPPCPPCEDPGVLLACLTIEDCEVIDICNLERTFVLSWPTMRYWLPFLRSIGSVFEWLCCEARGHLSKPRKLKTKQVNFTPTEHIAYFSDSTPTYSTIENDETFTTLFNIAGLEQDTARSFVNLAGNVHRVAVDTGAFERPEFRDFSIRLPELFAGGKTEAEFTAPDVIEILKEPMIIENLERVVDARVFTALADAPAPEAVAEFAPRMDGLERQLKNRLTATSMRETRAFKDVRAANTKLRESMRSLERSNKELMKRLEQLESTR
ncbi:MAG: hypothetical protein GY906_13940 [bacterium]|nr:hypothetical protein [bacterium]